MNIKDDFILKEINEGYLVGGCVRDWLMAADKKNFCICDRDIAIKNAESFSQKLAERFDATMVTLDSENHIYRVVLKDKINYLDISEMQGDTIEDDLQRRDFTINAIAYDLKNGEVVDVTAGMDDLKNGILRQIKDENFEDDPLRILRAYRFLAVTGFKPAEELQIALKKYQHLALNPAKERIAYELMKLFGGDYAAKTLLLMDADGLLEKIFPNVAEMKQVPPNSHHHLDLFHHVVETVRQIELLYKNSAEEIQAHLKQTDFGGFPRINHLKLAGFLHDIGKFSTWTLESDTCIPENCNNCTKDSRVCGVRHRFIKHDDVGSKLVVPLLRDLKFSKKQIEYIAGMIKNHIYPSNVIAAPELNEKVMMRYIRKMDSNVIDNIILAKADRLSALGQDITDEMIKNNINGLNTLLDFYLKKKDTLKPLPKLLDGKEIMTILNIPQSPKLGLVIKNLQEAQLNGDVVTRDDAIGFVKQLKIN